MCGPGRAFEATGLVSRGSLRYIPPTRPLIVIHRKDSPGQKQRTPGQRAYASRMLTL